LLQEYEAPKALLLDVVAAANRTKTVWQQSLGLCTVLGFPATWTRWN
jgi:hypothetical protein